MAAELNQLNTFEHDAVGTAQAFVYYRGLSADALRALAGLPGNDAAFTQITISPLDLSDSACANRRGPDDPDNFQIGDPNNPLASPTLRIFVDALDGRTTNRYFYRAVYVDAAHNRSAYSLATPPVFVPKVVAPQPPLVQLALAAEGKVRLQWMASPEPDLARFLVYRAADENEAADVRTMALVAQVAPTPSATPGPDEQLPAAVPGKPWLEYGDPAPPHRGWLYRIVAEDTSGNRSGASNALFGRAFQAPPAPPIWNAPVRQDDSILLSWTHPSDQRLTCLVERRIAGATLWVSPSGWLAPGIYQFVDTPADPSANWEYRLRVRDSLGQVSASWPTIPLSEQG